MGKIKILEESVAARIAAGEVIERPAGVLKELLENAVDAGADTINIDIDGAGKKLIRVNDNGSGMSKEDLTLSVVRHSTSKIKNFEDLDSLDTFGFRGEALYSVAAVSKLSISSAEEGGSGNKIIVEGGKLISVSPSPNIKGTTVEVKDLFYNTPARLKFLKSDNYERSLLLKVVEESALANLHVSYNVRTDGRLVYSFLASNGDFKKTVIQRAGQILGAEIAVSLISVEDERFGFKAFLTPLSKLTAVRDLQFFFINKRPLTSKTLQQAVYKAYHGRPKDRHPAFIVFMNMPAADFDVNIHPQKRDVKFAQENAVFGFLMNVTQRALTGAAQPVDINITPASPPAATMEFSFAKPRAEEPSYKPFGQNIVEENVFAPISKQAVVVKDFEDPVSYNPEPAEPKKEMGAHVQTDNPSWWQGPYRFLGSLHKSYLIYETELGLMLVDQHAARERVLYEEYLKKMEENELGIQPLMFPVTVDLPASNVENLMLWKDWLKTAGFEIEQFSPRTVLVNAVPNIFRFKEDSLKEFIVSLAGIVGDPLKSSDELKKKTVAMLACKKSIKAKEDVSMAEADALLLDLKRCQDGMHCPHGRPVMVSLSAAELTKKFGR
ncbi:DNA mismatch repair protein MutL [Elusimicrobium minutum Pei191]|uniref:DNA mismatch repair protein MutL n=1 Tax=Elusimicrobium minutum (strain Pei191) TaxID=445932 RepID=MUTL_ELUMP|nr:DNA mismatch repair endonuclease MutL [Elusimicrobium minutum]B2KB18.1 RecName: Full=DNA mismatch repair protein MutL [Elusimicrobium minutum Pei191]ACC97777.1 DNA mismatch repair protein MutL [Elusimicrobium minutum Pei191]